MRLTASEYQQSQRARNRNVGAHPTRGPDSKKRKPGSGLYKRIPLAAYFDGLPDPEAEYRFHPSRKWRFDLSWPAYKIALEQDGGIWTKGRHIRGAGFIKDLEKMNHAALLGWRVFRFTPQQVRRGEAKAMIEKALLGDF